MPGRFVAEARMNREYGPLNRVLLLLLFLLTIATGTVSANYDSTILPKPDGAMRIDALKSGSISADGSVIFNAWMTDHWRAARWTRESGTLLLPTLGGDASFANDVNDKGQVVGWSLLPTGERRAFSWTSQGGIVDLGAMGGIDSTANAVNESGQVVGRYSLAAPVNNAYSAFTWSEDNGMLDIDYEQYDSDPDIETRRSEGTAINDAGTVAAEAVYVYLSNGELADYYAHRRSYYWKAPGEALAFGGTYENGNARPLIVTDAEMIIGNEYNYEPKMFYWTAETGQRYVGGPRVTGGPYETTATSANRQGQVALDAGYYTPENPVRAYRWTLSDGLTYLGTLGNRYDGTLAIDEQGTIVGWSQIGDNYREDRHAFIWQESTGMVDLNDRVSLPASIYLKEAHDIGTEGSLLALSSNNDWMLLEEPGSNTDQDNDGVPDSQDRCADTILGIEPTIGATKGRFYSNDMGEFVDGSGRIADVSIIESGGCSGQQIIAAMNLGSSNLRYGIWERHLIDWALQGLDDTSVDQDNDGVPDDLDRCPFTTLGVEPTIGATKDRFYSLANGHFIDGRGRVSDVDVILAGGCSGQQIIAAMDLSSSNLRYGIWEAHLIDWALQGLNGEGHDQDADGVPDEDDQCPFTTLGVPPTIGATKDRFYALANGDFIDGRGRISRVSVTDTRGCSGQQIIVAMKLSSSNFQYGIWEGYLLAWVDYFR